MAKVVFQARLDPHQKESSISRARKVEMSNCSWMLERNFESVCELLPTEIVRFAVVTGRSKSFVESGLNQQWISGEIYATLVVRSSCIPFGAVCSCPFGAYTHDCLSARKTWLNGSSLLLSGDERVTLAVTGKLIDRRKGSIRKKSSRSFSDCMEESTMTREAV